MFKSTTLARFLRLLNARNLGNFTLHFACDQRNGAPITGTYKNALLTRKRHTRLQLATQEARNHMSFDAIVDLNEHLCSFCLLSLDFLPTIISASKRLQLSPDRSAISLAKNNKCADGKEMALANYLHQRAIDGENATNSRTQKSTN